MKTLFVCSERKISDHVGEYYDEIIEVEDQPTTVTIPPAAARVKSIIRALWKQDVEDKDRKGEPCVEARLDAVLPFVAMLLDFQYVLEREEGIKLLLPQVQRRGSETTDPEAQELLAKLERKV